MKNVLKKISTFFKTRLGFVLALVLIYWAKTLFAYIIDFNHLEIVFTKTGQGHLQWFIAAINPIPLGLLLIGLALYIKNTKIFYWLSFLIYLSLFGWLFANVIYFREFSDYITISTMMASSSVSAGISDMVFKMVHVTDLFYLIDFVFFGYLLVRKKFKTDKRPFNKRASFAVTALSAMLFTGNLFIAEMERPELLSRGFSNTQVVRSLGLPAFIAYNANQVYKTQQTRMQANSDDLKTVQEYVKQHYAKPNPEYFGIGKGRNVIYIHLESFQQFLIDFKLQSDGKEYEVTPFLNSLYHSKETFAFSNFFHQVKAGKTSDAETLFENSLFGLPEGSFMVQYAGSNTQQAAPHILQQYGYQDSAVFHGNKGTFWNRNNAYKQWGYHYFFDQSYFSEATSENSFEYGLNDKIMFHDSIKYLERLQQPFYAKYITVTNHYPFDGNLKGSETGFPYATTDDVTINGYFSTANYLDSSVKDFFDYLKAAGLYENSVIVLYGDHYGISNSRNPSLAPLLGKNTETWSQYDNAMMQRVPYMVVVPGMDKGHIVSTYGGEVDALPTLEHILGIDSSNFIQMGQDLLSPDNQQVVAFRNSDTYITPKFTSYAERIYNTQTGEEITNPDETTQAEIDAAKTAAATQLKMSDAVQTGDLLRFLNNGINPIRPEDYNYQNSMERLIATEQERGKKSTSLYSQLGKSTVDLFKSPTYQELNPDSSTSSSTSTSSN
ncbi:LTA synthase family protein [Streptococcus sp. DD13]|uniref:LTA synthase family protein n=1 Tax=Streptococcus sp. DD13 TaxID=1777881 RepID=UPI0007920ECC|nr:LTA synthase family protein [Streptococcus sp. DD13]KXT79165.1 Lipoteichoic acid synthase LtaS Type IIc [Streptococcus sp. DD13]